jgi:hypothetical protein
MGEGELTTERVSLGWEEVEEKGRRRERVGRGVRGLERDACRTSWGASLVAMLAGDSCGGARWEVRGQR